MPSNLKQELMQDVLEVITVLSARLYGLRSHQNKAILEELEKSAIMSLVIPDEILQASNMSEAELLQEIVLMLFQQKKISIGKASRLLGMNLIQFQHLIANRNINIHYDVEDFRADVATLKKLGRL